MKIIEYHTIPMHVRIMNTSMVFFSPTTARHPRGKRRPLLGHILVPPMRVQISQSHWGPGGQLPRGRVQPGGGRHTWKERSRSQREEYDFKGRKPQIETESHIRTVFRVRGVAPQTYICVLRKVAWTKNEKRELKEREDSNLGTSPTRNTVYKMMKMWVQVKIAGSVCDPHKMSTEI